MFNSRNMLTKRLSQSAAHTANKPEWHSQNLHNSHMILRGESVETCPGDGRILSLFSPLSIRKPCQDSTRQKQTLTVKTFSGCPRALILVSWICLRIIQASSCFPTCQGAECRIERRWDTLTGSHPQLLLKVLIWFPQDEVKWWKSQLQPHSAQ